MLFPFLHKTLSKLSTQKLREVDYASFVPIFNYNESITKTINQIYITPDHSEVTIPKIVTDNIAYLQGLNPDWEYKMWKNADIEVFIRKYYGDIIWNYYNRIDPHYGAAKADFFRYLLMYKEGGAYIDLKVLFHRPLTKCLENTDKFILSHWDNEKGESHENWGKLFSELDHIQGGEYIMSFIICPPGHPFLRMVIIQLCKNIDTYNPYQNDIGYGGTIRLSGPVMYTLIAEELLKTNPELFEVVKVVPEFKMEYMPGKNAEMKISDYRKASKPIIPHPNIIVRSINNVYFGMLSKYRSKILKK